MGVKEFGGRDGEFGLGDVIVLLAQHSFGDAIAEVNVDGFSSRDGDLSGFVARRHQNPLHHQPPLQKREGHVSERFEGLKLEACGRIWCGGLWGIVGLRSDGLWIW